MRQRIVWIVISVVACTLAAAAMQSPDLTPEQQTMLAGTYFPTSVAIDATGNFYIADANSGQIRKVTPIGAATFVAGVGTPGFSGDGGPAASAQLRNPFDIAIDAGGNLYIADSGNSGIRKVTANGVITTVAGNGNPGFSGDGGPATGAQLNNPRGIAIDAAGNLYIADTGNSRIRKIAPTGVITTISGNGLTANPGDNGPAIQARLRSPYGLVLDKSGNLYFADMAGLRVRRISADGQITTVAGNGERGSGGDDGPATAAQLQGPLGVALDATGNLYIAESGGFRVRQVTKDGTITTVAGNGTRGSGGDGGPPLAAQLDSPLRVAVGASANLYIVDAGAQRLRVISPGQIRDVPGTGRTATAFTALGDPNLLARVGGGVSPPSCKTVEPNYAEDARQAGHQGTVVLDAVVSVDGSVRPAGIRHPLGFGLDERAIAVLSQWKCTPSMRDGMPVDVLLQIQINFHLR
ncbi:MAG TPA: TonB family protein [Terriglobia bacterium]|nr:TonB family protein [Terriglobia bacterium]